MRPVLAGKAKTGMGYSIYGYILEWLVKLCDLLKCAPYLKHFWDEVAL